MIKPTYQYFLLAIGIFLLIGFPTFFSGCGTNIPNTCFAFTETTGTVYGYKITTDQCKECVEKDSDKKCTKYNHYTCYDGYVRISFQSFQSDNKNQTCLYESYSDQKSFSDVKAKLEYYYPEDNSNTLYVNKIDDSKCTFNSNRLKALTYVGIVFLSFGLGGIIGLIGYLLFDNIAKPFYAAIIPTISNIDSNTNTNQENNFNSIKNIEIV